MTTSTRTSGGRSATTTGTQASLRTRRTTNAPDPRDRHPLFTAYVAAWTEEINTSPVLSRLSPAAQASYAAQMARSSVRFDETVTHR